MDNVEKLLLFKCQINDILGDEGQQVYIYKVYSTMKSCLDTIAVSYY